MSQRTQTTSGRKPPRSALDAKLDLWVGQLFLWPGRALYIGDSADTESHAHHAVQICIGVGADCRLRRVCGGRWQRHAGVIIGADVVHQLDRGQRLALLYIDPECDEGLKLASSTRGSDIVPIEAARLEAVRRRLLLSKVQMSAADAMSALDEVIENLVTRRRTRPHDPRVAAALERLRRESRARHSLAEVAAEVALSPSHFAHLFRAGTGLPLRRYLLWLRLVEAVHYVARGGSLTEAAHAAGFADSAHLTRTFRRMFGVAPSAIARGSRFQDIAST